MRVAIIGAGLAGLTAARGLRRAGLSPVIYDKGRGPGGRLATRRAEGGLQFDHGAQYLSAGTPGFAAFLREAEHGGVARQWSIGDGSRKIVGSPGMNAIAKFLAQGADLRQGIDITSIESAPGGLSVSGETFDRVICTVPAPQASRLVGPWRRLVEALNGVVMEPNLTLMLALPARPGRAFVTRRDAEDDIAWLALDSAKHDRAGPDCWVAQAGLDWSRAHLEHDKDEIAARMLPLVCERLGADPAEAIYAAAHRWRYALTSAPLGQAFLDDAGTLFLGGDWALSADAEGAWQSGEAIAQALLDSR